MGDRLSFEAACALYSSFLTADKLRGEGYAAASNKANKALREAGWTLYLICEEAMRRRKKILFGDYYDADPK